MLINQHLYLLWCWRKGWDRIVHRSLCSRKMYKSHSLLHENRENFNFLPPPRNHHRLASFLPLRSLLRRMYLVRGCRFGAMRMRGLWEADSQKHSPLSLGGAEHTVCPDMPFKITEDVREEAGGSGALPWTSSRRSRCWVDDYRSLNYSR